MYRHARNHLAHKKEERETPFDAELGTEEQTPSADQETAPLQETSAASAAASAGAELDPTPS